jgi:hypothetical protein
MVFGIFTYFLQLYFSPKIWGFGGGAADANLS